MGCDGGTIPTRDELVRTRKKPEQKDKDSERLFQWQHCALTQEPLRKPIAACQLGRLYNKQSVIERLLDRSSNGSESNPDADKIIEHIKSLKDLRELDLTPNPAFGSNGDASNSSKKSSAGAVGDGGYVDRFVSPWICPVTGLEMNGRFRFVYEWPTGRVLSERAYKMVKSDETSRIAEEDVVVLNPAENSDESDLMRTKMEARKARAKAEKKAKKRSAAAAAAETPESATTSSKKDEKTKPKSSANGDAKKSKKPSGASGAGTSGAGTSGAGTSGAGTSGAGTSTSSVQKDASKSEVFKSLFSSHSSAQNKPKGHWVTFDPRYN